MKQYILSLCIASGVSIYCSIATDSTQAQETQIVQDGTLPNNSVVTQQGNIHTITEGTEADKNLFHSFRLFDIKAGDKAYFDVSGNINNILVRVTGSNPSKIMGTLATPEGSNTNLFLINPSGIVFGPEASLNIGGSFVATTANAIQFGNQGFFSASSPNNPALLTIQPSAFLFNQIANQGSITNQSAAGLQVPTGKSLLLLGGNVNLDRDSLLQATGGRVELAGVAGEGAVGLVESNNLRLTFSDSLARAEVSLTSAAIYAENGGNIVINARNIDLQNTELIAGINSVSTQTGDITFNATEKITIAKSFISNDVDVGGSTGGIYIKAGSLSLSNSELSASTYGNGSTAGVFIQANDFVSIANSSINSNVENPQAVGSTGGINIKAGSVFLKDRTTLNASTYGQGNTSGIFVQADNLVSIIESFIKTVTEATANAGDINIQAGDIVLTNGSLLQTSSADEGQAGNVMIEARSTVSFDNSFILSDTSGNGNGGIIDLKTRTLSLTNGAELLSITKGQGNGGNIQINAFESVTISGVNPVQGNLISGVIASSEENARGQGGNISVTTANLQVSKGSVLNARTTSAGRAGNINVNTNTLELNNGGQFVTSTFSSGNAGNITVNATDSVSISGSDPTIVTRLSKFGRILIDNDSSNSGLFARVQGNQAADAGKIEVTARSIILDKQGTIATETKVGEGGDISLKAKNIFLRDNSNISATAGTNNAGGNGGNISINTDLFVSLGNSEITANAFTGRGGNIRLSTQGLFRSPDSDITASSQFGVDGVVEINKPDPDPSSGLVVLPENLVDISQQIDTSCKPKSRQTASSFEVTGRGGIPESPYESLIADALRVDWITLTSEKETHSGESTIAIATPTPAAPQTIIEATEWVRNADGEVLLIASVSNTAPRSSWHLTQCGHVTR